MMTRDAQQIAKDAAAEFFAVWLEAMLDQLPPRERRPAGRPRLAIPEQYRKSYPYWRCRYGAAMAREMAGIPARTASRMAGAA